MQPDMQDSCGSCGSYWLWPTSAWFSSAAVTSLPAEQHPPGFHLLL
jgi:hypothetical protein